MKGIVLLCSVALVSGIQIGTKPVHTVIQEGMDARLNCTVGDLYGKDEWLVWKERISNPLEGAPIYKTDMDGPNDPDDYTIEGQYDLIVKNADIKDGGFYSCETSAPESVAAFLIVVKPPVHMQNTVDFIEGMTYNYGCSVQYGTPNNLIEEANKPTLRANIGNRPIAPQEPERSTGVVGESASSASIKFNFTALPEMDGQTLNCTVMVEEPEFKLSTPHTLSVQHVVTSANILNRKNKYRIGEKIRCKSNGNPKPTYTWTSLSGDIQMQEITGENLTITDSMVGSNEWECKANNTVDGKDGEAVANINFEAVEEPVNAAPTCAWRMGVVVNVLVASLLYIFF